MALNAWRATLRLRDALHVYVWGVVLIPLFVVGKLIPRTRNLWVFGSAAGFADNSRFLFEYVSQHESGIEAVWLARDRRVVDKVRRAGHRAEAILSLSGIRVAFRASVGVIASGLGDINRAATGGMVLVNLWHGTPLKRILLDAEYDTASRGERAVRWLSLQLIRRASRLYTIVTAASEVAAERLASAFGLPRERVVVTGQPRADAILATKPRDQLRSQLDIDPHSRVILYVPTWRETSAWHPPWHDMDLKSWEEMLTHHEASLLIKPHPCTTLDPVGVEFTNAQRVRLISPLECPDLNIELPQIDVLITDYSSVVFDWALLERPILLFAPDHREYEAKPGLYEPYVRFAGEGFATSWVELSDKLEEVLIGADQRAIVAARRINRTYNTFHDACNSARVMKAIQSTLRIA